MKYISNIFIKNLIYNSSIVKIISSKINLEKFGNKYRSFCPFHLEKNPSFIVDENKKFFYCFGCKCHGNVIDFLMRFSNLNFVESIKELSKFFGIKLIFIDKKNVKNNIFYNYKKFFDKLMLEISIFYHNTLFLNKENIFLKKFLKSRNLNSKIIKKFFIGYSSYKDLKKFLLNYDKKKIDFLLKIGILIKDFNGNIYDKLQNRVIFPIYNIYNKIVAFGGRSIFLKYKYKYINSCSNIFFKKKKCLYGLNNIKNCYFKLKRIIVVEGYLDVISLYKNGFFYVVGLLGSSISENQIKILYLYTENIIFCYDGDDSGLNSIKKTIKLISSYINENKKSYFIILPKGEDPDSLINKEGRDKFKNRIKNAKSFFYFLFFFFIKKSIFLNIEEKIYFVKKFILLVNKIKSNIIRIFLYQKLLNRVGLNFIKLINPKLNNFNKKMFFFNRKIIIRYLIVLLIKNPNLSKLVNLSDYFFYVNRLVLFFFFKIVKICIYNININIFKIIKFLEYDRYKIYIKYLYLNIFISDKINIKFFFLFLLNKLKIIFIDKKIKEIFLYSKNYGWNKKNKKKVWFLIKLKNFIK